MVPTRRFVVLAFVASAVAVAAGFVPGVDAAWLALDAVVVLLAGADLLSGRGRRIAAERRAPQILSVGRANTIAITLHNESDRTLRGTLMDDPIEDGDVTGLPGTFELAPRSSAVLRYDVTPTRRGKRTLRAITVRYALPAGMLQRQERIELPEDVDVYPDVHAARELEMLRRKGRADARVGSLRVRGGDTEFERLRPYQHGDEIRRIDWRASARRDDLVVRQYQAESDQNVVFAIDVGRGMRGESEGLTSIDRALAASLLTADVALRGGDKAGLFTFDAEPRTFLRPTGGRSGGRKLTRAAYALDAGLSATDYRAAMVFLKTQMKARSLLVLFTNLLDPRGAKELAAAVKSLVPRHLPLCVLMRDPEVERLATSGDDLFVRAAAGEALVWRDGIVRALEGAGALVLDAEPADVTPSLVRRYLEIKARRLL
jgi:uncharacterized protein (DUF58 family)